MGIKFEKAMVNPQDGGGDTGHGHLDPKRKIDNSSMYKFRDVLTREEGEYIIEQTRGATEAFGYELSWDEIGLKSTG